MAVLILVHEFGHFIVAKKSGVRVDEFGLGFPPKIIAKKWGETMYTLNAIPFGGFVKIFGEDEHSGPISEADKTTSFQYKPKWIQAAVLVAGVTMNLIFAWFLISVGFMIGLPTSVGYTGFGQVKDTRLVITEIIPGSPAEKAGLISGDVISSVSDGNTTLQNTNLTPDVLKEMISKSSSKDISITYIRGDSQPVTLSVEPDTETIVGKRAIGIAMDEIGTLKLPVYLALIEGARTTLLFTKNTISGLLGFFWDIVRFKSDFSEVSGPIGIASVVGQAKSLGFVYLLSLVALISINLAVINLLPFPALDGGRLLFVLIEAITRRPIPKKFVGIANTAGFAVLIILMLVVTGHDIFKLL